jgi:type IV pilus biogenesis protein CpaD/CtpE
MKKSFLKVSFLSGVFAISACVSDPSQFRQNVGIPEAMIDTSSELVTVKLVNKESLSKLSSVISRDIPDRAELRCSLASVKCSQAKALLTSKSVSVSMGSDKSNVVALFYDRTVVRDCDPKYTDNMHTGLEDADVPASFGCAVTANVVQMVSDRKQFTNPALMDLPDAEKGGQTYQNYLKPSSKDSGDSSSTGGFSSGSSSNQ